MIEGNYRGKAGTHAAVYIYTRVQLNSRIDARDVTRLRAAQLPSLVIIMWVSYYTDGDARPTRLVNEIRARGCCMRALAYLYIYIYIRVCVCVCVFVRVNVSLCTRPENFGEWLV